VSLMQATPSTWRMLVDSGCFPFAPGLRILCGGEAMPWDLAQQLLERAPVVWNMYGPTETTIWSTVHKLTRADTAVTIGRPIANTRLYILDAWLQPVPLGVAGELHIAGDGVADGYLNQDELTRSRFIGDPFGAPGATMYKTGDLARYKADGAVDYLGRLDQQVKIRGFRIELGEIENRLVEHEQVGAAVVLARPDAAGGQRLLAYVSMTAAAPLAVQAAVASLKSWLTQALPEFMVPPHVMVIDAWPLTPNGKIDRKALPEPDARDLQGAYAAPATATEVRLVALWAELLELDGSRIGTDASFFALGGHSLMLVRLVSRIDGQFQVRLDIRDLFEMSTIARIAALIDDVLALRQPGAHLSPTPGEELAEFEI